MKFLVDANLPVKLAQSLQAKGYDVIHTDNLPNSCYAKIVVRSGSFVKDKHFIDSASFRNRFTVQFQTYA